MFKRIMLTLIVFSVVLIAGNFDIYNYKDKEPSQLSGMQDYVTIPNTEYWNNNAYKQIYDIIQYNLRNLNDPGKRVRYVQDYSDIWMAIRDSIYSYPQPGKIVFAPNDTTVVRDSTVYLASNMSLEIPPGHFIDWYNANWNTCGNAELFRAWGDSNITIVGGNLYGNSEKYDDVKGLLYDNDVNGDSLTIVVTGITVAADSMANWHCVNLTTSEHDYVSSNTATSSGRTSVTLKTKRSTLGTIGSDYVVFSPNNQWNHAFGFWDCKNVIIKDVRISNFGGDGINLIDTDSVLIDGVDIKTKARFFVEPMLIGRQGISLIYNAAGSEYGDGGACIYNAAGSEYGDGGACHPEGKEIYSDTSISSIRVVNSHIDGGYYAVDFEPNTTGGTIRDVIFANNLITNDEGSGIGSDTNMNLKHVIIANNVIDVKGYGLFFSSNNENYCIEHMWIVGNEIRCGGGAALYLRGNIKNLHILGNTFSARDTTGPEALLTMYMPSDSVDGRPKHSYIQNVDISNNVFYHAPKRAINFYNASPWTHRISDINITNNTIVNPGYRSFTSNNFAPVYIANCSRINVRGNFVFENTGRNEMKRPFEFVGCDSLVVSDNVTYGSWYSNSAVFWACSNYYDIDNTWGYPGDGGSSSESTTSDLGFETMTPAPTNHVIIDTVLVDSGFVYHIQHFGKFGTDSVMYWSAIGTRDTLLFTTLSDTSIRVYNDSLFVASSDSIIADSISIKKKLFGHREDHYQQVFGDTAATTAGDWANEHWYSWLTYRDVINPRNNILGALLRAVNYSTYSNAGGPVAQRTEVELYANEDDRQVAHTGDVTRTFKATGGKFEPDNLILPYDRFSPRLDGSVDTLAVENGMILVRNDTIFIYTAGSWKHWVATGTGYDPTDYE